MRLYNPLDKAQKKHRKNTVAVKVPYLSRFLYSSNLSISAKRKPAEMRVFSLFLRVFGIFGLCKSCCFLRSFCI